MLTVTPSTGLADGQTVTLHGSGWEPGHDIGFCQGSRLEPPSPSDCADGRFAVVVVDGPGSSSGRSLVVVSFRNPTNASVGGFWGLAFPHIMNDD